MIVLGEHAFSFFFPPARFEASSRKLVVFGDSLSMGVFVPG